MYSIEVCLLGWCVCVLGAFICWVCICWVCIHLFGVFSYWRCILLLKICSSTDSMLRQIDYLIQGILNDTQYIPQHQYNTGSDTNKQTTYKNPHQ